MKTLARIAPFCYIHLDALTQNSKAWQKYYLAIESELFTFFDGLWKKIQISCKRAFGVSEVRNISNSPIFPISAPIHFYETTLF